MEIFKSSADGGRNLQEFQICFIILNVVGLKELVLKTVDFTLESSSLEGSAARKRPVQGLVRKAGSVRMRCPKAS